MRHAPAQDTGSVEGIVFRSVVVVVGGALLGLYAAARRRVLQGLTERAERAERERHLLAERARAEERARLAAEMHDVVAHRVTLMVLQAGALRVRAPDEPTRAAAEELRGTGCQALEELRDVIGLLRRDPGEAPSAPLPGLTALVAESAAVGVPVELAEHGDPPSASPAARRIAYRIVQEALTNARKHAPGAAVHVDVRYRTDGVALTVRNAAPSREPDAELAASGSGTGLAGLRERVELIGGTFEAGPHRGGFRVEASLPAYVPLARPAP
ncbi:histidine kinase [Actinomadura sp. NPDC049753]|uniref:sensor histidine kinase n=1 Tax=Actinomadura sp. NPDC049753 TaxID=3154739 RepID=UPI00341D251A